MKGLMKYLSPFAPDISGASEVLFKMNGLIVIIDAGGCTGNVCGFDEPRWKTEKSAIFSAGLRDLDAILGRDEAMMRKVGEVLELMGTAEFLALVGTPVPSVIATDYQALKRMGQRRFGITTLTVPTTGMELYDKGQERAYMELIREYAGSAEKTGPEDTACTGIFGATPLDLLESDTEDMVRERVGRCGGEDVRVFGSNVGDFREAPRFRENLVVSPSGLAPAMYMKEKYGVPFKVRYPLPEAFADCLLSGMDAGRVLVIHQAVLAETVRGQILRSRPGIQCDAATFFMPFGDVISLREEDDFIGLVEERRYDVIIADPLLSRAVSGCGAGFIPLPHFAVSGEPM